jgi:hypothetical protein
LAAGATASSKSRNTSSAGRTRAFPTNLALLPGTARQDRRGRYRWVIAHGLLVLRDTLAYVTEIHPAAEPDRSALIAEATKRAGLVWISVPGHDRPYPAWHIWRPGAAQADGASPPPPGAAYVVTGPGEQPLPGLGEDGLLQAGQVTVTVPSKDSGGSLISWTAAVSRVAAGSAEWEAVCGSLAAGRLNAVLEPGETSLTQRWARSATIFRLAPTGISPTGPR